MCICQSLRESQFCRWVEDLARIIEEDLPKKLDHYRMVTLFILIYMNLLVIPSEKKKLLNRKRRANEENDKATEIFNKEQKFNNSEKITESNHFSENEVQEILSHTLVKV